MARGAAAATAAAISPSVGLKERRPFLDFTQTSGKRSELRPARLVWEVISVFDSFQNAVSINPIRKA